MVADEIVTPQAEILRRVPFRSSSLSANAQLVRRCAKGLSNITCLTPPSTHVHGVFQVPSLEKWIQALHKTWVIADNRTRPSMLHFPVPWASRRHSRSLTCFLRLVSANDQTFTSREAGFYALLGQNLARSSLQQVLTPSVWAPVPRRGDQARLVLTGRGVAAYAVCTQYDDFIGEQQRGVAKRYAGRLGNCAMIEQMASSDSGRRSDLMQNLSDSYLLYRA